MSTEPGQLQSWVTGCVGTEASTTNASLSGRGAAGLAGCAGRSSSAGATLIDSMHRSRSRRGSAPTFPLLVRLVSRHAGGDAGERVCRVEWIERERVLAGLVARGLGEHEQSRCGAAARERGVAPLPGVVVWRCDDHRVLEGGGLGEVAGDRVGVFKRSGARVREREQDGARVSDRDRDAGGVDRGDAAPGAVRAYFSRRFAR